MQESIVFCITCIRCRRKESSRLLSHLLMSFLYNVQLRRLTVHITYSTPGSLAMQSAVLARILSVYYVLVLCSDE